VPQGEKLRKKAMREREAKLERHNRPKRARRRRENPLRKTLRESRIDRNSRPKDQRQGKTCEMPLLVRRDRSQGRREEPCLFTWARDPAKPAGDLKIILLHVGLFFVLHGRSKQENTAWQECHGRREDTHKLRHKAANDMFEDNSSTNL
jgi:hypothetical protein